MLPDVGLQGRRRTAGQSPQRGSSASPWNSRRASPHVEDVVARLRFSASIQTLHFAHVPPSRAKPSLRALIALTARSVPGGTRPRTGAPMSEKQGPRSHPPLFIPGIRQPGTSAGTASCVTSGCGRNEPSLPGRAFTVLVRFLHDVNQSDADYACAVGRDLPGLLLSVAAPTLVGGRPSTTTLFLPKRRLKS